MSNKMITLVSDLDGTLLDGSGRIPQEFESLLDLATDFEIDFIFASSRAPQNIVDLFAPFELSYRAICSDGSSVISVERDKYTPLRETNLTLDQVDTIVQKLLACRVNPVLLFTNLSSKLRIYTIGGAPAKELIRVIDDGREIIEIEGLDTLFGENDISAVRAISYFGRTNKVYEIQDRFLPESVAGVRVYSYLETRFFNGEYSWFDCLPSNVSKGEALKNLLGPINNNSQTIALGNGANDESLFEFADYSFCPINATPELKRKAFAILKAKNGGPFITSLMLQIKHLAYE